MDKGQDTARAYLDSLKATIEQMEPIERACATLAVQLGRIIAELINQRDWVTIDNLESVCNDLFIQAQQVRQETNGQQQH